MRRIWVPCPRFWRAGLLTPPPSSRSNHFDISRCLPVSDPCFPTCHPNSSNSQRLNTLPPRSNDTQKVIDTYYTFVLFFRVFATRKSRPALLAPLPFAFSSYSSLFFSEACSLFSVTAVSQPFAYQSFRHSFHRDGGCTPYRTIQPSAYPSKRFRPLPLRAPKSRRINTYETSRKCCKQRTCKIAKSFRCNTYEKQGGEGCYG